MALESRAGIGAPAYLGWRPPGLRLEVSAPLAPAAAPRAIRRRRWPRAWRGLPVESSPRCPPAVRRARDQSARCSACCALRGAAPAKPQRAPARRRRSCACRCCRRARPEPRRRPHFALAAHRDLFLLCLVLLAYLIARMTTRPLKRLAQAATELGARHQPAAAARARAGGVRAGHRRVQRDAGAHPPLRRRAHRDAGRHRARPADAAHAPASASGKGGRRRAARQADRRPRRRPRLMMREGLDLATQHRCRRPDAAGGPRFAAVERLRRRRRRRPRRHADRADARLDAGPIPVRLAALPRPT